MAEPTQPPGDVPDPADRIERLLEPVVELATAADREAALERLCAAHPDVAGPLRSRFRLWQDLLVPEPAPGAPVRFGDYELIRPLGSGGMGIVWLAQQRLTPADGSGQGVVREVALKMIRDRGLFSHEARERFRREAQAALRVEHPGICPVYDVGEHEGTPFLAMRNVPGRPLSTWIDWAAQRDQQLELPDPATVSSGTTIASGGGGSGGRGLARRRLATTLRYVERAARALHEAHEAGLVHRDVKPGNLMVTPGGDPVVLDFGLARDDSADQQDLTISGSPVGTPAYMAPEQISPQGRRIDRATDIHALGATLFECLTLRPPFQADTREELYLRILHDPPPRPRRHDSTLPRDLDVVVETAMRKEPERRYATAHEFAEDLRRVRELQPIQAHPTGPVLRARLWAQRNPLVSVVLFLLLVSQLAIAWQTFQVAEQARIAGDERQRADARAREASEARHAADQRAREASASGERAEAALADARAAVQQLVTAAQERLRDLPEVEAVRGELIETAIGFHRRFLERYGDGPRLQRDAALSRLAAGELLIDLGRYEEGIALLQRSQEVFDEAFARDPRDYRAANDSGRSAHLLSVGHRALGQLEASRAALEKAVHDKRIGLRSAEDLPSYTVSLSTSIGALADSCREAGDDQTALTLCDEVVELLDGLGEPLVGETLRRAIASRATIFRIRGRVHRDRGEGERAREDFEASLAAYRVLLDEPLPSRETRSSFAATLMAAAIEERRAMNSEGARKMLVEACAVLGSLREDFPGNQQILRSLATAWNNLATAERQRGATAEARAALQRASEIQDELLDLVGEVFDARLAKAMTLYNLGNLERREVGMRQAEERYRAAWQTLLPWSMAADCPMDGLQLASRISTNLAIALALSDRGEEADAQFDAAIAITDRLLARTPDSLATRNSLARLLHNRGVRARESREVALAERHLRRALDLRTELSASGSMRRISVFIDRLATASQLCAAVVESGDEARGRDLASAELQWFETLDQAICNALLAHVRVRVDLAGLHNDRVATAHAGQRGLVGSSRSVPELLRPIFDNDVATPRTFAERWRALVLAWEYEDRSVRPTVLDEWAAALREAIPTPNDWKDADPLVVRQLCDLAQRTQRILRLHDRDAGSREPALRALLDAGD